MQCDLEICPSIVVNLFFSILPRYALYAAVLLMKLLLRLLC